MNIPRINNKEVQAVLKRDDLTNREKAEKIRSIDYNMTSRETNGLLPGIMSVCEIEKELNKHLDSV